jgi:hypothetical protein
MQEEKTNLSYNEFLAFVMIYAAGMNSGLSQEELAFIKEKTMVTDIDKIKAQVDGMTDSENIELIDNYKKRYIAGDEGSAKAKADLEGLLKTGGQHSQLEKVAVHIIEKFF